MLAAISSHAPLGMDGELVSVEVDIRRGLPGIDVVGLPDGAVIESKERVRVAIRNSGYLFPTDRVLISLAPAGVRKAGASFDLPIALAILAASEQITTGGRVAMVLGELNLGGAVRPVNGVLSAIGTGLEAGIGTFLVPRENLKEARVLGKGLVAGIGSLKEAAEALQDPRTCLASAECTEEGDAEMQPRAAWEDITDIRGHDGLKHALEIAAAGRHHLLLFGPPGSGKTMAARRLPSILPPLDREESLAVTRIHSIAGVLPPGAGLVTTPPYRSPHHSASAEGILGGGHLLKPGEVSLAHNGVLFLDEAPEFGMSLLQGLREPVEDGWVSLARAGCTVRYPSSMQLVLAFNPCPCGNMGRPTHVCRCSALEIARYWRRVGGALLDRIDLRVPLEPVPAEQMCCAADPSAGDKIRARVRTAAAIQRDRYRGYPFLWNSRIPPGLIDAFCPLSAGSRAALLEAGKAMSLSSRAFHAVLRMARTIADLEESTAILPRHVTEASFQRRYGDNDFYWVHGR